MNMEKDARYLRMRCTIYVKLRDDESPEDGEDRFLECLPEGIDCAGYNSDMWLPDAEC